MPKGAFLSVTSVSPKRSPSLIQSKYSAFVCRMGTGQVHRSGKRTVDGGDKEDNSAIGERYPRD
jgi:hypothetical protein